MVSTFFGIEIAKSALLASQQALNVVNHNVANVNTEGYTKQRAEVSTRFPYTIPSFHHPASPGQIGTGTKIAAIKQLKDLYIESQINQQTSLKSNYETAKRAIESLQIILGDPFVNSVTTVLDEFFGEVEELSNNPESMAVRSNLREKANTLISTFRSVYQQLKDLMRDQDETVVKKVEEVNNYAHQIAELNLRISKAVAYGDEPNDLRDQRDLLVKKLAELVNVRRIDHEDGTVSLLIQNVHLVDRDKVYPLEVIEERGKYGGVHKVYFPLHLPATIVNGELAGLLKNRDERIPEVLDRLNNLVSVLVNRFNYQHRLGYGLDGKKGRAFFKDLYVREIVGRTLMPASSLNEKTLLSDLGVSAGTFFVQGAKITLTTSEVTDHTSITLGELLDRINRAQNYVRFSIEETSVGNRVVVRLYNPPDSQWRIDLQEGSSNFLSLLGIREEEQVEAPGMNDYVNALEAFDLDVGVKNDLKVIAASGEVNGTFGGEGDNTNALELAKLRHAELIDGSTLQEYWSNLVTDVGSEGQRLESLVKTQEGLIAELERKRQSVSGVSLDEETVNMIRFQKEFQGAAKMISIIDSMLDTIINRMGAG